MTILLILGLLDFWRGFYRTAPQQQALIGLIPAPLCIRLRTGLASNPPRSFHGYLRCLALHHEDNPLT